MHDKKNTVLVCGGAGFMGSDFVRYMLSKKSVLKLIVYDKLTYAGNLDNLASVARDKRYVFIKGDICDAKKLRYVVKKYNPGILVNFAAESHVDLSIHGKAAEFIRSNIYGVHVLLDTVKDNPVIEKYLQISTDEVYGDTSFTSKVKFNEKSPLRPSNPYSVTKASGDMMCLAYHRTYGIPVVITRSGNNFGPYQYPEKFISQSILKVGAGQLVPVYGKGRNIRNWVYVRDHSRAVETVISKGIPGEVYNIGTDQYFQNIDIVRKVIKAFGASEKLIKFVSDRPGHDRRYAPYASKLKNLGWMSHYTFEKGLYETIQWYNQNTQWVKKVKKKLVHINSHIKA